ncbi:hypothetical protein [Corallococcus macrosporus]|uniref:Uncharacterized protein n=2 Tax=Myxococcaceae TaxID=31 RepID=A0A250JZS3_9BACT|nr:hypothetical protein [Corallococcus macrosporus]AEI68054.1 hypothetical protein LILAB_30865 [Corallococcus macrosporus]ATB48841.1 hypothetical protein MYMAC_004472 [Corallococcus macrosporus DSM 14697]
MWTMRGWKVTLLCGWLAAPVAVAGSALEDAVPLEARAARGGELLATEPLFPDAGSSEWEGPMLRYAEPLSCPAAPEGRVWVAETQACDGEGCEAVTTVWAGAWTVEEAGLEVRCETDRVVLAAGAWRMVLTPGAGGGLEVSELTPPEPEALSAARPSEAPASEG